MKIKSQNPCDIKSKLKKFEEVGLLKSSLNTEIKNKKTQNSINRRSFKSIKRETSLRSVSKSQSLKKDHYKTMKNSFITPNKSANRSFDVKNKTPARSPVKNNKTNLTQIHISN